MCSRRQGRIPLPPCRVAEQARVSFPDRLTADGSDLADAGVRPALRFRTGPVKPANGCERTKAAERIREIQIAGSLRHFNPTVFLGIPGSCGETISRRHSTISARSPQHNTENRNHEGSK